MRAPLLAPKGFVLFEPQEFHEYVRSLYIEPPKPAPLSDYSLRMNAKGNPVLTIRRKPKYLTRGEVKSLAEELSWSYQKFWLHLVKKKIEIRPR